MENYTIGLALFDYLPVIAAGFGLYLICKYCGLISNYAGPWILIIPAVALTGGILKATWKLIWAWQAIDYHWMSDALFFFLASGYILMASLLINALRARRNSGDLRTNWWIIPLVLVLLVVAAALYVKFTTDGRTWSFMLLGTLSLANLVFLVALILHAKYLRNRLALGAFCGNLILSYVLVGLARIPEQTAELQWIEEILNLCSNSMLAVGAWALIKGLSVSRQEPSNA